MLLSGGVDSAYLLTYVEKPRCAIFVDYGQPSNVYEERSARVLAEVTSCDLVVVTIKNAPLGDMATHAGPHVVPARNLWLVSLAAAHGHRVWIGAAPQDQADYADCRTEFLERLRDAMRAIGNDLAWSPATRASRVDALKSRELLHLTWSCYYAGPEPCGECPSCLQ